MLALNVNTMISNFTDLLMILLVTWVFVDAPIANHHAEHLSLHELYHFIFLKNLAKY